MKKKALMAVAFFAISLFADESVGGIGLVVPEGGFGVEPKIVYRYGYVDGKFFDPWEETFENSIQKPVFRKKGEYTGVGSRWSTMGTPCYSTPCK